MRPCERAAREGVHYQTAWRWRDAILDLTSLHVSAAIASLTLTVFWAMVTAELPASAAWAGAAAFGLARPRLLGPAAADD